MRIALGADERTRLVDRLVELLEARGHAVTRFGRAAGEDEAWGPTAVRVGRAVAARDADLGVVCCWTGTGVSIAANKVAGIRGALCTDGETARDVFLIAGSCEAPGAGTTPTCSRSACG